MRTRHASLVLALLLAVATAAHSQQAPQGPGPGAPGGAQPGDPLMGKLFPPELIMQNQAAIGLSDDQRSYLVAEIQRTQNTATGIQWRLQAAVERLGSAVGQDHPDEGQVLTQLDSVLALEREMKRAQIGLLVRLKGRLTSEQQAALRQRMHPGEE